MTIMTKNDLIERNMQLAGRPGLKVSEKVFQASRRVLPRKSLPQQIRPPIKDQNEIRMNKIKGLTGPRTAFTGRLDRFACATSVPLQRQLAHRFH